MQRFCPTINQLLSFESAARHSSVTQAAKELCVTQGAVSRNILSLEEWLGVALFERINHRLILTDAGKLYLTKVRPSIHTLEAATVDLRSNAFKFDTLNLACAPTFASHWLIPKLASFQALYPDIQVNFIPYALAESLMFENDCTAVIRYGEGVWSNTESLYVLGKELVAVASPQLASLIHDPNDLVGKPLLHHTSVLHAWESWRQVNQVAGLDSYTGMRLEQYNMIIQAAKAGLGVALVPKFTVESLVQEGSLMPLFNSVIQGWKGYYLCYPQKNQQLRSLVAFREWLESHKKRRKDRVIR